MSRGSSLTINVSDDEEERIQNGRHLYAKPPNVPPSSQFIMEQTRPANLIADLNQSGTDTLRPFRKRHTESPYTKQFLEREQKKDDRTNDILKIPFMNRVTGLPPEAIAVSSTGSSSKSDLVNVRTPPGSWQLIPTPTYPLCPEAAPAYSTKEGIFFQPANPEGFPAAWTEMPTSQAHFLHHLAQQQMVHNMIGQQTHLARIQQSPILVNSQHLVMNTGQSGSLKEKSSSLSTKHSVSQAVSTPVSSARTSNIPHHVIQLAQTSVKSKKRSTSEAISRQQSLQHTIEKVVDTHFDQGKASKRKSVEYPRSSSSSSNSMVIESVKGMRNSYECSGGGSFEVKRKESIEKANVSFRPESNICEDQTCEDKSTKDSDSCNLTILETFSLRDCSTLSDNSESGSVALDLSIKTLNRSGSDISSNFESQESSPSVTDTRKTTTGTSCLLDELCKKAFYQCCNELCTFSTVHPTEFEVHLAEVHSESSVYMCVHCGHAAKSSDMLLKHLHDHIQEDLEQSTLTCSYVSCPFQTQKPEVMIRHINIDHQREQHHVCCKCNETFKKCFDLLTHMKGHFLTVAKCPHCSAKDVSKKNILRHMHQCHPEKGNVMCVTVLRFIICKDRSLNRWPLSLSLLQEKSDKESLRTMAELSPLKLPSNKSEQNKHLQSPEMPNLTDDCYPKASEDPLLQKSTVNIPSTVSNNGKEYVPIMSVKVAGSGIEVEKIPSNGAQPEAEPVAQLEAPASASDHPGVVSVEVQSSSSIDNETPMIKTEPQDTDYEIPLNQCAIKQEPLEKNVSEQFMSPSAISTTNKSLLQKVNVCNRCDFYTSSNGAIYRHLKTVHKIDDMFQCSECLRCVAQDDVIEHHAKYHSTADESYIPTSISNCYRIKYMQKSVYKSKQKEKKKLKEIKDSHATPDVPLDDVASGLLGRFNSAKEGDVVKLSSLESNFFEQLMQGKSKKNAKRPLPQETPEDSNVLQEAAEEPPTKKSPVGKSPLHKNRRKKRALLFTPKKKRGQKKRPRVDNHQEGHLAKKQKSLETQVDSSPEDNTEEFEQSYEECEADITEPSGPTEQPAEEQQEEAEEQQEEAAEHEEAEEHEYTEEQFGDTMEQEPKETNEDEENQIEQTHEHLLEQSHQDSIEQPQGVSAESPQYHPQDDSEDPCHRRSSPRMTRNKLLSVYYKDQESSSEDCSSEGFQRKTNKTLQDLSRHSDDDNDEIESLPDLAPPLNEVSTLKNSVSSESFEISNESLGVNNNLEQKDLELEKNHQGKTKKERKSPKTKSMHVKTPKNEPISPNKLVLVQSSPGSNWTVKKSPIKSLGKKKIIQTEDDTTAPNLTFSQVNFDDEDYEFRCKYCTYRKGTLDKFLHHTYYHFHYRPYACGFCSFKAFSHNRILTHINTDHPKQAKNPIVKRIENEKAEARCQKTAMICFIPKHIDDVSLRIRLEKKKQKALMKKQMKKENGGIEKKLKIKKEPKQKKLKTLNSNKAIFKKGPVKARLLKNQSDGSYLCPYCRTNRPLMTWNKLVIEVCYHIHYKPFTCPYCKDCDTASKVCLEKHIEKCHPKDKVVVKENRCPAKEIRLKQLLQRSMDLSKKYRQDKKHQEQLVRAKKEKKKVQRIKKELPVLVKVAEVFEDSSSPVPNDAANSDTAEPSGDTTASTLITSETIERTISAVLVSRNGQLEPQAPLPQDRRIRKSEELFKEVLDDYGAPLYECLMCDHTIRNLKSMYTHSYKHQPKIFKCAYCELASYPRSAILWHQKKFHRRLKSNVINMATLKF